LLVEVPGISRFSQNQLVLGSKRTAYFNSETGRR
jgi:hypothetical protein